MRTYLVCGGVERDSIRHAADILQKSCEQGTEPIVVTGKDQALALSAIRIAAATHAETVFLEELDHPDMDAIKSVPEFMCKLLGEKGLSLCPEDPRDLIVVMDEEVVSSVVYNPFLSIRPPLDHGAVYQPWTDQEDKLI